MLLPYTVKGANYQASRATMISPRFCRPPPSDTAGHPTQSHPPLCTVSQISLEFYCGAVSLSLSLKSTDPSPNSWPRTTINQHRCFQSYCWYLLPLVVNCPYSHFHKVEAHLQSFVSHFLSLLYMVMFIVSALLTQPEPLAHTPEGFLQAGEHRCML